MTTIVHITPPGSARGAGFEAPFEMLHACHERVERMLALMQRLREHVEQAGVDEQARQAARDVMRYFDVAAPEHHRDEERHVFPALLALNDQQLAAVVERLRQDHTQMEAGWQAARAVLDALATGERRTLESGDVAALEAFAQLYAGHIEAEETIAFPRASAVIEGDRLEAMSRDMMARRGLTTPGE